LDKESALKKKGVAEMEEEEEIYGAPLIHRWLASSVISRYTWL
jgi:hypothetical protein